MNKKIHILEFVDANRPMFIHPQPLVWVSFLSSTTSGIDLFLFIHSLWYRSLFIHPQPLALFSFYKETYTRGYG
jgi:hypothetical protein